MLEIVDLEVGYGSGPSVLQHASVDVQRGEIVALVGLNGAGKSTTVKAASGLLPVRSGRITFEDEDITSLGTDARVRRGLAMVPEGRQLFPELTVAETLRLGTVGSSGRSVREAEKHVYGLFPVLADRRHQVATTMSGGEQQMLAIGRALMSGPKLLILDEPSLGLAPRVIDQIFSTLTMLRDQGLTLLLVEQNATFALDTSDRAFVLQLGEVVESGKSAEIREGDHLERLLTGSPDGEEAVQADQFQADQGQKEIRLPRYKSAAELTRKVRR